MSRLVFTTLSWKPSNDLSPNSRCCLVEQVGKSWYVNFLEEPEGLGDSVRRFGTFETAQQLRIDAYPDLQGWLSYLALDGWELARLDEHECIKTAIFQSGFDSLVRHDQPIEIGFPESRDAKTLAVLVTHNMETRFIPYRIVLAGTAPGTRASHLLMQTPQSRLAYNVQAGCIEAVWNRDSIWSEVALLAFTKTQECWTGPTFSLQGQPRKTMKRRPRLVWLEARLGSIVGRKIPIIDRHHVLRVPGTIESAAGRRLNETAAGLYGLDYEGHQAIVIDASQRSRPQLLDQLSNGLLRICGSREAAETALHSFRDRDYTPLEEIWPED